MQYSWFNKQCRQRIEYYSRHSEFPDFAEVFNVSDQWMYDYRVREPVVFGVALCVADKVYNPISGEVIEMEKADFTYLIIIIDFACVFIIIFFIQLVEFRYKRYAAIFDKRNIEMRDFTVAITNLPKDFMYGGKKMQL